MDFETRKAYTELCLVLEYMPNEYVRKIPEKIIRLFQNERLENYEPNINKLNPLDKNCLSKKTMVLLAMLNYQYWCPNKKVKDNLYKMYLFNNSKYQKEIEEKYVTDDLFKNKKKIIQATQEENISIVEYKESIFKKMISKIKKILGVKPL